MATLTEMVAAVVVHSSAAAFSHFGVTLEAEKIERPQPVAERVIARTPRKVAPAKMSAARTDDPSDERQLQPARTSVGKA